MHSLYALQLALASLLLLAVPAVLGQDPTTFLTAYPPQNVTNCGGSPYTITAQAWQISQCVYTVKYTVQGRPGLSDFGFQLGTGTRSITVTGCTTTWVNSGGNGNACYPTYSVWEGAGGLIKMNSDQGCNQNATFWITSSAATLVQGGSVAWKGGQNCWTCNNVPYVLANHPDPASCPAVLPSPSGSPAPSPDPLPSPSASPVVVVAPSPSTSPEALASPSTSPSMSDPPLPSESPLAPSTPSPSPVDPSPSPSPVVVTEPSPSPSPVVVTEPSPSPSPVVVTEPSPSPSPVVITEPSPSPSPVVVNEPSPSPSASSSPTSSPLPGGGGDSTNAGAIAGGVAGGLAGLAGLAALGGAAAGGGYMLYRWINRSDTLAAPASALDSNAATAVGDNALFQETNVMQPNVLFVDGV